MRKETAKALQELQQSSEPIVLLETIRRCQGQLALLSSGEQASSRGGTATAPVDANVRAVPWRGSSRASSCCGRKASRDRNEQKPHPGKRISIVPFEADAELMRQWLGEEPIVTPKELMERLIEKDPNRYRMLHLRTMQRRVSSYRMAEIKRELRETQEARQRRDQKVERTKNAVLPGVKSIG